MPDTTFPPAPAVRLLLHSSEDTTLGGPSVRVPRSAEALRQIGQPAQASSFRGAAEIAEDMVHLFNVWPPDSALAALRALKAAGKRVVFSPIYLDFSQMPLWEPLQQPGLAASDRAALRRQLRQRGAHHEILPGFHAMIREMLALADHVILLSETERSALAQIGAAPPPERTSLVHNPVDAALWQEADPALFRAAHLPAGAGDYLACIGRVEPRKNQLTLARALHGLPLHLALIGHAADASYAERIRAELGPRLIRPGRLEPGGEMLRSALAGARAFVLPSWAEGASLAALEAAAAGVPLVLSDSSSEREYFGDLARYCDPGDPASLRAAITATLADRDAAARAAELRAHVGRKLDWHSYAAATAKAYRQAATQASLQAASPTEPGENPEAPLAGEILPAGQAGARPESAHTPALRFGTGWLPPEEDHRRIAGGGPAEIRLRANRALRPGQAQQLLHLRLRAIAPVQKPEHPAKYPAEAQVANLRVSCAGATLYDAPVSAASLGSSLPRDLLLRVPASALDAAGDLQLAIALNGSPGFGLGLDFARLLDTELGNPLYGLHAPQHWGDGQQPQEVDFARPAHRAALAPDLRAFPAWGLGSRAERLVLFLPLLPGAPAQSLQLSLRPVARDGAPSGARIFCNARLLATLQWHDSTPVEITLPLRASDLQAGPAALILEPLSQASPADLGLGPERGLAGLGLLDLSLTPDLTSCQTPSR
ncbi:glycosyltransferase [Alloyangia pacifica]|uniref:glycosyltransferase n=1 Tax=Alloyangia pacifica TaxID=311180 RepID=UPI001CD60946|nr:glycosyltransferase [Alloyangia pacifica]MCA0998661.1 glycosyltransferase [Alloyangia pacifica]